MPSTWNGANDGFWDDGTNWLGAMPDAVAAEAEFNLTGQTAPLTVQLRSSQPITVGRIDLSNAAHGLTLSAFDSPSTFIFDHDGSAAPSINNSSAGDLTFAGGSAMILNLTEATVFNVTSTGAINVSGSITGSRLIKTGSGTLNLTGSNSFGDGMLVQGGRVTAIADANLGSDTITMSNGAEFRFLASGTYDNAISVLASAIAAEGSATLVATNGTTVSLTGALRHHGAGTLTLGEAGSNGTIIAAFSFAGHNGLVNASYTLAGGTVQIGGATAASDFLRFAGSGLLSIAAGAVLDTAGFTTYLTNLDLNGGTIRSSSGTLDLRVRDQSAASLVQNGTINGTGGADNITIEITGNFASGGSYDMSGLTFTNWSAGIDSVTIYSSGLGPLSTVVGSMVNDRIFGEGGLDSVFGGDGDDEIIFQANNTGSSADGGSGIDTLTVNSGGHLAIGSVSNMERINLLLDSTLNISGATFASGFAVNTVVSGIGRVTVNLTEGQLLLTTGFTQTAGSSVAFTINGNNGVEVFKLSLDFAYIVDGGTGGDQIRTGNQADQIFGGDGNDKIMGLAGADEIWGGTGADQFRMLFATDSGTGLGADQIRDWVSGTDKLDFRGLDANPSLAGRQALTYIGTGAFSATGQAELRWADLGADLRVYVDLDGNGTSDMEILLVGAGNQMLSAADFMF